MKKNEKLVKISRKVIALRKEAKKEAFEALEKARKFAIRVETARTVTGFLSESLLSTVDNLLKIAIPLVSFSGDFELSALLNNLKLWLDKKRAEQAAADAQRAQMQGMSASDLTFSYSF